MKCENCGNILSTKSNFCRICGTPVVKPVIELDNRLDEKESEFTGNIDMSKVVVEKESRFEDFDDDSLEETGDFDKKLEAMKEISRPEVVHQTVVDKHDDIGENKIDINVKVNSDLNSFQQFKIDSMPGEVCEIKLQSTKELEDMIASELMNASKEEDKSNDNEATILIPDSITDLSFKGDYFVPEQNNKTDEGPKEIENVLSSDNKTDEVSFEQGDKEEQTENIKENNVGDSKQTVLINDNSKANFRITEENNEIPKSKKGSKLGYVFLLLIIIASLFGMTYLYVLYSNSQEEVSKLTKEYNEILNNSNQEQHVQDTVDSNKVFYNGYVFSKRDDMTYKTLCEIILIQKDDMKFYSSIRHNISFDTIKNKMENYKDILEKQDLDVKSYGTKMIDGRNYVVFEVATDNDDILLIAYTKVSDLDSIGVVVENSNNDIKYDNLSIFNEILNSINKDEKMDELQLDLFNLKINE